MKFRPFVSIVIAVLLLFACSGQTAFASTVAVTRGDAPKLSANMDGANIAIPAPTANVSSGIYQSSLDVKLSDSYRKHVTIYYTLDGSVPTTAGNVYNKPVRITASCTLNAIAADAAGNTSGVLSNAYTIQASPSASTVQAASAAETAVPSATLSAAPSADASPSQSAGPSAVPSEAAPSPSIAPSATPSAEASSSPSVSPSADPSAEVSPSPSSLPSAEASPSPTAAATPALFSTTALSSWVAYWDWQDGLNNVNEMAQTPGSIELFGASFNSDDKLFLPDEMQGLPAAASAMQSAHPGMQVYLTIVNDRQDANGKWTDKDSSLLDRLMKSDASRTSNINDILAMVSQGNYSGVEIDYEEFSDTAWKGFTVYCSQLYNALKAKGLGLRVCLESYAPFSAGSLPAGPEYTIMAYSLHWEGSDPGPKADAPFIKEVAQELKALPGDKRMAFAGGGYDWDANGNCDEVTEQEAAQLSQKSTNLQRDSQSDAMHFTYQSKGVTHTVWYADGQTLKSWMNQAVSLGIGNVALWKMGGNSPETMKALSGVQ